MSRRSHQPKNMRRQDLRQGWGVAPRNGRSRRDRNSQDLVPFRSTVAARPMTYRFMRNSDVSVIAAAAADQGVLIQFTLSGCINSSEFTNLFDQYRILSVELVMWYERTVQNTEGDSLYPYMSYSVDWDGQAAAPVSSAEVLQHDNGKVKAFTDTDPLIKIRIDRPGVVAPIGTSSAIVHSLRSPWIDCADATIPHYGLLAFISKYNTGSGADGQLRYFSRVHLEFRSTR